MAKSDTIKQRRVDVYLDSFDRKERWTRIADEQDESLSKFVQKAVEYTIERGGPDFEELGQESKRINQLQEEISDLRKDVKQKDLVIEKLQSELAKHRMEPFLEEQFEGTRQFDRDLIDMLQASERITGDEILRQLDIHPTETELVKGVNNQLQLLEMYGLVRNTPKGWVWDV